MDRTVAQAQKTGYVETLFGRRRRVDEINSKNRFRAEGAQRIAINSPIQGTSADIIKIAMIRIEENIRKNDYRSRMLLTVHDELVFEVWQPEKEDFLKMAVREMENVEVFAPDKKTMQPLSVALKTDYGFGKNWDEAH